MKRGKDDDKIGGPMFPRLHVNDTEKGGPRAPPRNKMALYEQLSIPSQRFNSGVLPVNSNSTTNSGRPASSNQAGRNERGTIFPLQLPQSMHPVEKASSRYSDANNQLIQQELKKKQDEDDFRVPIFVQSGSNQDCRGNHHMRDREGHTPILTPAPATSAYTSRLGKHHSANERAPKQRDATDLNLRQECISQSEENSQGFVVGLEQSVKSASNQMFRQGSRDPLKHFIHASKSCSQSRSNGAIQHDLGVEAQRDSTVWGDSVSTEAIRVVDYRNSSIPTRESQQEMLRSPNEPTNGDAVSETSMVDSLSGIDISPDDVVGIIGQKHFWKARRAIVNQQRVFAVQVFELHRLIKVQKLIAGSPQLLVEELGKPVEVSPAKKLPLEYIVKSTPTISKHNEDECKKSDLNMEFSAENATEKASLSSVQFPNYKQFPGNSLPTSDPKMGHWSFNQQLGHQWLIPVMTPSEGLVYKPYPGPEFMSPVCGGIGPPGTPLMVGHNFPNYGVPPSHHHYLGHGVPPFAPPPSHGYFPAYAMPPMNPAISNSAGKQMNHFNMQYESSCNAPSEKNGPAAPSVGKFHAFKDSELQVSTASSPSERTQGRNALPLFPTSPVVQRQDGIPNQLHNADQPARVIKVVPHTARSANASVARIFQSIQEERNNFDSV